MTHAARGASVGTVTTISLVDPDPAPNAAGAVGARAVDPAIARLGDRPAACLRSAVAAQYNLAGAAARTLAKGSMSRWRPHRTELLVARCRVAIVCAALTAACGENQKAPPPAPPPRSIEAPSPWRRPSCARPATTSARCCLARASTCCPRWPATCAASTSDRAREVEAGAPLVEVDAREETAALDSGGGAGSSAAAQLELARQTLARAEAL